jgi:hypothetical protein
MLCSGRHFADVETEAAAHPERAAARRPSFAHGHRVEVVKVTVTNVCRFIGVDQSIFGVRLQRLEQTKADSTVTVGAYDQRLGL